MVIGIASGKGGTGKTTVAANLAVTLAEQDVLFLDCDVEEPNAHLFLKPRLTFREEIVLEVPQIDEKRCDLCGKCREICRFNAIAVLPRVIMTFQELCHGCGGCFMVCPRQAVLPAKRLIGHVEKGLCGSFRFVHGRLRVGEAMAAPLIRKVMECFDGKGLAIVDAPPGTSCPVIAVLRGCDYAVLVTEPTPFGLNDLKLAVGAARILGLPMGIVINRSDMGDGSVREYAAEERIPVLSEIPFDRRVAEVYARGELPVNHLPGWKEAMEELFVTICREYQEDRSGSRG